MELSLIILIYFIAASFMIGFSKTSVDGLGILVVLLMALAFSGKASVGILLPMLVFADIIAVIFYKKSCDWKLIFKIFPLTALGVVLGYFIIDMISKETFDLALGLIILLMLVLGEVLQRKKLEINNNKIIRALVGVFAGLASLIANAAGPLLAIYFVNLGLEKKTFIGTRSWYFLLLNLFKLPFLTNLDLITFDSLKLDLIALPFIVLGAFVGVKFLKKIDMKYFLNLTKIAALFACVKLIAF